MAVPLLAKQAQKGSKGIALFIRELSNRRGGGQRHTLDTSFPENRPGTHCTGGWLGLQVGLDGSRKSCLCQHLKSQAIQPVLSHYADHAIPTPFEHE
jgi:hypothetical protein